MERLYLIRSEVRKILILDDDIPYIAMCRKEFEKFDKWHEDLTAVMKFDPDTSEIKADKDLLRKLIG